MASSPPQSAPTQGPPPRYSLSDKLAIALACGSAAIVVALFLAEKTPIVVVLLILLMVALSIHPILHFIHRNIWRVVVGAAVATLAVVFGLQGVKHISHAEQRTLASSTPPQSQNTIPAPPHQPTEQPQAVRDYPSVELRPAIPRIEFSFLSSGDKRQKVTSSVLPKDIELEPLPTLVKDEELPKDVKVTGGTVTVLRFGRGYMLFDTGGAPVGTIIRGRIITYDNITSPTRKSAPPKKKAPGVDHASRENSAGGGTTQPSQSCPNGICIGGANFGNPTVNNYGPELPRISWSIMDKPPLKEAVNPEVWVHIAIDRDFLNARFAVICDRPCKAVRGNVISPHGGYIQSEWGTIPNAENIAAFQVNGPNPMPVDATYDACVESGDNLPPHIVAVKTLTIRPAP